MNQSSTVFNKQVEKNIITKVYARVKELIKINSRKLNGIKNTQYNYIEHFLAISQDKVIFDYCIIESIINKLDISKSSKSKKRKEL
ncbi:hypothetical protein [Clostridium baratii]|uniref:Uncharacterized protein n=1 Tax=Clostridium baratii TaxID=1561 RepID=A0A174VVS7_9CLOT|nr:hypothetical protein [Clostridium baratii]CUQ35019.1 Uncharacterised protein [Clostridium baratii]